MYDLTGRCLPRVGRVFLDDVDRDVRSVLGHLPRGTEPPTQVRREASEDGFTGNGGRRDQ